MIWSCEFLCAGHSVPDECSQVGFAPRNEPISLLPGRVWGFCFVLGISLSPSHVAPLPLLRFSESCGIKGKKPLFFLTLSGRVDRTSHLELSRFWLILKCRWSQDEMETYGEEGPLSSASRSFAWFLEICHFKQNITHSERTPWFVLFRVFSWWRGVEF